MSMQPVVFLSPITPSPRGPGLAMRADRIIRALARNRPVHVRIVPMHDLRPAAPPLYEGPYETCEHVWDTNRPWSRRRARQALSDERSRALRAKLAATISGLTPSVILSFRHAMAPFAEPLIRDPARARWVLDLDELESSTRSRIANLHAVRGELRLSARLGREVEEHRIRETRDLRRPDQIWVCSDPEADRVRTAVDRSAIVVPNVVPLPDLRHLETELGSRSSPERSHRTRLLFVGGLAYLPNLDAVEWCGREVLPLLNADGENEFELRVVGRAGARARRRLGAIPRVDLVGRADDLAREYANADLCVVPIRAGGGTRIKLLEALAHRRPVVSTGLGAEGLELEDGEHLLIADSAREFAAACGSLSRDADTAARLGAMGVARVAERYAPRALELAIETALDRLGAAGRP